MTAAPVRASRGAKALAIVPQAEADPEADWPVLIQPGEYEMVYLAFEKFELAGSRRKWRIRWELVNGPEAGTKLWMYVVRPDEGQRLTVSMKLVELFQVATDLRVPPRDLWRLPPASFLAGDCIFIGTVVTVTRNAKQQERRETGHYSIVERIVCRAAGAPRRVQR